MVDSEKPDGPTTVKCDWSASIRRGERRLTASRGISDKHVTLDMAFDGTALPPFSVHVGDLREWCMHVLAMTVGDKGSG